VKIGFVVQQAPELRWPPFDGPAEHIRNVVGSLQQLGHSVRLVVGFNGAAWSSEDLDILQPVTPSSRGGVGRHLERGARRMQSSLRLPYLNLFDSHHFSLACVRELKDVDLLYERLSWTGYGGHWAAGRLGLPHALEYNGDPLLDLEAKKIAPRGLQRRFACWGMRRILNQADHIVASGHGWRRQLLEAWGVEAGRVTVVENGTALLGLLERSQLSSFGPEIPVDRPIEVVYLGGFLPWHGIDRLLLAAAKIGQEGLRFRLRLIGSGPGLEAAEVLAGELGIRDRVAFLGNRLPAEYGPMLAGSDLAVSPYCGWKEYSGLKLLDYKAAGLAIVASGEGGEPATLSHGFTGLIVPPCDVEALAQAILTLAASPSLRRSMGQAARLEAELHHSWARTAGSLERLFEQLISRGVIHEA